MSKSCFHFHFCFILTYFLDMDIYHAVYKCAMNSVRVALGFVEWHDQGGPRLHSLASYLHINGKDSRSLSD